MGKELLSRRDFLKGTGALAVASALGLPLLSCEEDRFLDISSLQPGTKDNVTVPEKPVIYTPENYTSLKFLSNPFRNDPKMQIQQGWFYTWKNEKGELDLHNGIDFIKGEIDRSSTWEPFDVLAAADGWAWINPEDRQGNAVFIEHSVLKQKFYTYCGHLEEMENFPPYYIYNDKGEKVHPDGKPVRRGQKIGVAGASGVTNERGESEPTWIHLHFGTQDVNGPLDPYDLHGQRSAYPNPNFSNTKDLGPRSLWK